MVDTVFVAGQQHAGHLRRNAARERTSLVHAAQRAAAAAAAPGASQDALLAYTEAQQRLQEHSHRAARLRPRAPASLTGTSQKPPLSTFTPPTAAAPRGTASFAS